MAEEAVAAPGDALQERLAKSCLDDRHVQDEDAVVVMETLFDIHADVRYLIEHLVDEEEDGSGKEEES